MTKYLFNLIKQMVYMLIASFLQRYISKVVHHTLQNHAGLVICPQHGVK